MQRNTDLEDRSIFEPIPEIEQRTKDPALSREREDRTRFWRWVRRKNNLSNPKPGHTTGESRRGGARRGGRAGPGRTRRGADGSVRPGNERLSCPPGHGRQLSWTSLRKHEQANSYINLRRNKTRGWQPVHPRFITGTASALRSWLLTNVPTPICLCRPF